MKQIKLKDLYVITKGIVSGKKTERSNDSIPGLFVKNLHGENDDFPEFFFPKTNSRSMKYYEKYIARKGDLIISGKGCLQTIHRVGDRLKDRICMEFGVILLKPREDINADYVYFVLKSEYGRDLLQSINRCVVNKKDHYFRLKDFSNLEIPYPDTELEYNHMDLLVEEIVKAEKEIISKKKQLYSFFTDGGK